jgi:hypothetical protein
VPRSPALTAHGNPAAMPAFADLSPSDRSSRARHLPATVIEHLRRCDPALLKASEADAARLAGQAVRLEGPAEGAVRQILDRQIDAFVEAYASRHRLPRDQAAELLGASRPAQLRGTLEATSLLFNLLVNWQLAGRQLFHVLPDLVERLVNTSVKAPAELVRLPFPTVMLVYGDERAFEAFGGAGGRIDAKQGALSVIVSELEVEGERRLTFGAMRANGRRMTRQIFRSLLLRDGWNTEQAISTDWRRISGTNGGMDTYFLEHGAALSRLVLNTILYLGSASARVSGVRRNHPSTHQDARNFSILPHQRVGEGVTYLRAPSGNADPGGGKGQGSRQLVTRHYVMGHWKSQAYGTGGALRQAVWIEPYLRGPEAADLVERNYVVR